MTKDEILKIKEHIEIHARRERRAVMITEILWKAVDELEHITDIEKENEQIKEYNTDLKQSLDWANERETEWSNRIEELKTDLKYAKAVIKDLLNNSHEYAKQNAEDFIKGERK